MKKENKEYKGPSTEWTRTTATKERRGRPKKNRFWKVNLLKAKLQLKKLQERRWSSQLKCRSTARTAGLEDLYREEQGTDEPEVIGVNLQGRGSGSGGENTDLSHRQVNGPEQMDDANHLEKEFHSRGIQCSKKEAKAISSLIGSLGADIKASVPLNEGLCLSVEDKGWKLQKQSEVEALFKKLDEEKPTLMVGLPPDGPFAGVQRSYNSLLKVAKEREKEVLEAGRKQVRTCVEAFRYQLGQSKYYLQECPKGAKSGSILSTNS